MTSSTVKASPTSSRRTARRLAPVLALAALGAIGAAQPAQAAPWTGDSVVGGGFSSVGTYFSLDAAADPDGGAPMGHASFNNNGTIRAGAVTCLKVTGHAAVFGVKDTRPGSAPVYRQFLVIDHGKPAADGAEVDVLREVGAGWSSERPCAEPAGLDGYGYVLRTGDIAVHDTTA
jgi:hypothetical protein